MQRLRQDASRLLRDSNGSALLELAISLPLLVVFIVGIYDFSGAYNQKQKLESAAQEGAIVAAAQPTGDIETTNGDPQSLRSVVTAIFNSVAGSGVMPNANQGMCSATNATASKTGPLQWTYAIQGCPDTINIIINRGWVPNVGAVPPITDASTLTVGTLVTVVYPYRWRFNSAIQLLLPGATYNATTYLSETAKVHNQL
jgi:Flp pilus assembly protein TadG